MSINEEQSEAAVTPPRIDIVRASLTGMLDAFGRQFANSPTIEVALRGLSTAQWRFEQIGRAFVAECDGFVRCYWHDGSDKNLGGFGGSTQEIEMLDGTKRELQGSWAGSPTQFYTEASKKFGHMSEFTYINLDESNRYPDLKYAGLWMRMERIIEACKMITPVEGKGASMFNAVPIITPSSRIEFAIIKQAGSGYLWAAEGKEARDSHDYPLLSVSPSYSQLRAIEEANSALRLRAARIEADRLLDDAERRLQAARIEAEPVLRSPIQPWAQRIHDVVSGNIPSDYPTVEDREAERSRVHRGSHAEGQGQ